MKELTAEQEYYATILKEYYNVFDIELPSYIDPADYKDQIRSIMKRPSTGLSTSAANWFIKYKWLFKLL
jgi:hypothetical protein